MSFGYNTEGRRVDVNDVLYYNLTITGISPQNSGLIYGDKQFPINASVVTSQNIPILEKPEDYYGSVVRMSVACASLPIIQFLIQTPVNDINLGIYSFTLKNNSFTSAQTFMRFTPERFFPATTVPPTGTPTQTFNNYYFLYDYTILMDIMNTALASAVASFNSLAGTSISVPFFNYNADTGRFSLYAESATYDQNGNADPVIIYFNGATENYMQAIPYFTTNYGHLQGLDSYIRITNGQGLNVKTINDIVYTVVPQQYISLTYMSYLKSIILGTQMNIVTEGSYINDPVSLQSSINVGILTDFQPDISVPQAGISSSIFIYNAPSLYRIFQFKQNSPLYSLSTNVYFTDTLDNIYPLSLPKGTSINIKFMFIKKNMLKLI